MSINIHIYIYVPPEVAMYSIIVKPVGSTVRYVPAKYAVINRTLNGHDDVRHLSFSLYLDSLLNKSRERLSST
jgi:hypothetical protein